MTTVTLSDVTETNSITVTAVAHTPISYRTRGAWHAIVGRTSVIAQDGPMLPQAGTLTIDVPDHDTYTDLVALFRPGDGESTSLAIVRSDTAAATGVWLNAVILVIELSFTPWIDGNPRRQATITYQQVDDAPDESS